MSEVFSDDLLNNVREINKILRSWRASRLESAAKVNSVFGVRVRSVVAPGSATGFDMIVPMEPLRVVCIIVSTSDLVFLMPGNDEGDREGFYLPFGKMLALTLTDHPGLVSLDWYFGTRSTAGAKVWTIEVLDRRRR